MNSPTTVPSQTSLGRGTVVRRLVMTAGGLLLAGLLGYFGIGAYVIARLTQINRQSPLSSPEAYGLPYEEVTIHTRDGLALAGWFIRAAESGPAVVMVHGHTSCRGCEFDGRFVELAAELHRAGFSILMIDLRAHGESEGRRFTLGEYERWDVLGAVDWLRERGFERIGVLGVSLGAAAAVKAAADPEGGQNIDALVLDSGFGDVSELVEKRFPEESGLPPAFLPGVLLMGRLLLHVDIDKIRPVADLPRIKAPVMLIFSEKDQQIPLHQFHAMAAARPDAEVWLVDDAEHARIYNAHPQAYVTRVSRFLAEALR